mmetsp:Transcript_10734/g.15997  ORF Transcript_10734/g.15997 Transcript_10734/m.15997 type:complete len:149 (+) Transcript_10734:51-497(+)|eukprot:CAMPEP_0167753368 /NCGR_PEP_ID=MMETSP0110_2-20121227/7672_1 /TAXON_ID=629695 /ORGANISM="Gymnochlora sp., Strain CCMP2014" /LENGTH=148 /DNA_ID=CAMNT_0007639121 /DNA_START=37 /DNA_END=483 /DNA_ORIENTATION=+
MEEVSEKEEPVTEIIIPSVTTKKKKSGKKKRKVNLDSEKKTKKKKKKGKKKRKLILPSADSVEVPDWDVEVESSGPEKEEPKKDEDLKRARRHVSERYNNVAPPEALHKVDEDALFRVKPWISKEKQKELEEKKRTKGKRGGGEILEL